ncbi:hypothetical protein [Bartonella sp. HY761]|uniref:hypothetical protein n=1 Tax=Bartonella sp. HY761 TaxID=2979330 RepID=UPI00220334CC|nr:hypothetical protein [Bartonella sp. HY761]UXN07599.1 hypothetical protein N6A79_06350 [Bartonella sp. HY761]
MTILIGSGIFGLSVLLPFYHWTTSIGPWGFFVLVMLGVIYIFIGYRIAKLIYTKVQNWDGKTKDGLGNLKAIWFGLFIVLCYLIVLYSVLHCYNELSELASHHFGFTLSEISYDNAVKVCIAILALFTLMIAVWRGALHSLQEKAQSKQAKIAADQIILGNRQFELANRQFDLATENLIETQNNNIAKLLIDGTKLLGDGTTEAEKMAGIACLSHIIETKSKFAERAAQVLIWHFKAKNNEKSGPIKTYEEDYYYFAMILDVINRFGEINNKKINVGYCSICSVLKEVENLLWHNIDNIIYNGFIFNEVHFTIDAPKHTVINCTFNYCKFDIGNWRNTGVYQNSSTFNHCIFGTSPQVDQFTHTNGFTRFPPGQKFNGPCFYDDRFITEGSLISQFIGCHIEPLSGRKSDNTDIIITMQIP